MESHRNLKHVAISSLTQEGRDLFDHGRWRRRREVHISGPDRDLGSTSAPPQHSTQILSAGPPHVKHAWVRGVWTFWKSSSRTSPPLVQHLSAQLVPWLVALFRPFCESTILFFCFSRWRHRPSWADISARWGRGDAFPSTGGGNPYPHPGCLVRRPPLRDLKNQKKKREQINVSDLDRVCIRVSSMAFFLGRAVINPGKDMARNEMNSRRVVGVTRA